MIELYNFSMSVCAAKVRMVLEEKGLQWGNRYTNIHKDESRTPEYLKLNPNGNVPTLVHNGKVVYESTIINEYLEDAFPEPPLMPADAVGRARVRKWTIQLDVSIHMAMRTLNSSIAFRYMHLQKPREELEAYIEAMQTPDKKARLRASYFQGVDSPYVKEALDRYEKLILDMENELSDGRTWLVANQFTLAECGYASYFTNLQNLQLSWIWDRRPLFSAWFERIKERPAYKKAIVDWFDPEMVGQMREKGAEVKERLKTLMQAT